MKRRRDGAGAGKDQIGRNGSFFRKLTAAVLVLFFGLSAPQTFVFSADTGADTEVQLIFRSSPQAEIAVYDEPVARGDGEEAEQGRFLIENAHAGQIYSYEVRAKGYTTEIASFVLTNTDLSSGKKTIEVRLSPLTGKGYETSKVKIWSQETEAEKFSLDSLYNVDLSVLCTPAFRNTKRDNQFTAAAERTAFLQRLEKSGNGRLYFLDEDRQCPVMIFSRADLSGAATLNEAAAMLSESKKVTVLYQAQIHGNEPAAGEGALAVAASLAGQKSNLLSAANVVIVPCANPYGAERFVRYGNSEELDLNRDGLTLTSQMTRRLHRLYNLLLPEVFIDGHEFSPFLKFLQKSGGEYLLKGLDDIQLTCVESLNRKEGLYEAEKEMLLETVECLQDKGFRPFIYPPSANASTSCGYSRLHNAYTFLVESSGIELGRNHYQRRVLSHYEAVMSLLSQVCADSEQIVRNVDRARTEQIETGKVYDTADKFVLQHGTDKTEGITLIRPLYDFLGKETGDPLRTETVYNTGKAVKSRVRPTAYIIGKNAANRKQMAELLRANGAEVKQLTASVKLTVRQYKGSTAKALLTGKKTLTFRKGAYVCFMDQEAANVISAMLEPDFADNGGKAVSFAQRGIMKKLSGGSYPLYRCEFSQPQKKIRHFR